VGPAGVLQPLASQAQNFPLGPGEPPIESGVDEQEPFPDEQNFEVEPNPSDTSPAPSFGIPLELELEADQQSFDGGLQRFIATGDVTLVVAGGRLKADRLEYDPFNRVIWARGAVRFQRGNQYLQASLLRYNLLQGEGELQDVYGVVDLVTSLVDLDPDAPVGAPDSEDEVETFPAFGPLQAEQPTPRSVEPLGPSEPMACPADVPPLRSRLPGPWAVTAWGGQMTDATFGETFLFSGTPRPEGVFGLGFNRRLLDADPFSIELDGNALFHNSATNRNLRYKGGIPDDQQDTAETRAQSFWEGTIGIGLRWWIQPWLSFGFVEGVSLNSALSNYEAASWEYSSKFLNYLAAEIAVQVNPQWSVVGRIHHRSGAYGTYDGAEEGSNGYLLGVRYNFGESPKPKEQAGMAPPLGCDDPNRADRQLVLPLEQQLEAVVFDGPSAQEAPLESNLTSVVKQQPSLTAEEQLQQRRAAIAALDQRVTDVTPREGLGISTSVGSSGFDRLSRREQQFSVATPQNQLRELGEQAKLVSGKITHWRFQAPNLRITPEGWQASRLSFTSDPFTPAQAWVDADQVVATEEPDGTTVIEARRNRLVLENKLPIPISRTVRLSPAEDQEDSVGNRWAVLVDESDRDGFFVQYSLPDRRIGASKLSVRPQFMLQRALEGETASYPEPNAKPGAADINQPIDSADLFGVDARWEGPLGDGEYKLRSNISSFNPKHLPNAVRASGIYLQPLRLPVLGDVQGRGFSAYRYRVWNGSLGLQDIYSAFGGSLEKTGRFPELLGLQSLYFWRLEGGNYQSNAFKTTDFTEQFRATAYGTVRMSWPIWRGESLPLTSEGAYRYSPVPIIPGLSFDVVPYVSLSSYADGDQQNLLGISGGPSLTLGHFNRPLFDYTRLSLYGSATSKSGESPFSFDEFVDLGTLGINLTQQLVGPLVLKGSIGYNVSGDSGYYGEVTNSFFGLSWQRRAYQVEAYFSPYTGMGGLRVRLNDFGFKGTGIPFVPYDYSTGLERVPGAQPAIR
jgi:hypothetical protein